MLKVEKTTERIIITMNNLDFQPITETTPEMIALFREALGPGRFARSAYRIRETANQTLGFGFNAMSGNRLLGTISITPVSISGNDGACLIGPLVVTPEDRNKGHGLNLIERAIEEAKARGLKLAILVGDAEYYDKGGFTRIPPGQITLPGPVAPHRLLAREIIPGALAEFDGQVRAL